MIFHYPPLAAFTPASFSRDGPTAVLDQNGPRDSTLCQARIVAGVSGSAGCFVFAPLSLRASKSLVYRSDAPQTIGDEDGWERG
jgi:hypothetical protein